MMCRLGQGTYTHVGDLALRVPIAPLAPLRLIWLCQIASSEGGRAKHCSPPPFGLSCGAILLCHLSPSATRALTSHPWRGRALFASTRRANFGYNVETHFSFDEGPRCDRS